MVGVTGDAIETNAIFESRFVICDGLLEWLFFISFGKHHFVMQKSPYEGITEQNYNFNLLIRY